MGISIETVATEVRKVIKGSGYRLEMFTEDGDQTLDDRTARRFFLKPSNIMVTIDEDDKTLKLHKPDTVELDQIEGLHGTLKNLASKYRLNFDYKSFGHALKPKDYVHQAIKALNDEELDMKPMAEGMSPMSGSTKSSYQLVDDKVKLIARHSKPVDEAVRGSRSRNIKALFIENGAGERFQYPHIHLAGARAMARHVSMGGTPYDTVGTHIAKLSEDYKKLQRFVRYAKSNHVVTEENASIVDAVRERYDGIKRDLSRLTSVKGYAQQVEAIQEEVFEASEDKIAELRDMFTARTFDESLNEVLPLISQIVEYRLSKDAKKATGDKLKDMDLLVQKSEDVSFYKPSESQEKYASAKILKFSEPKYEYGYKVRELAGLIEDDLLSSFLSSVANNDKAMEVLASLEQKGVRTTSPAGVVVQNVMDAANEKGIFDKIENADDANDADDEFAKQDAEDMPDDFNPPKVESKKFKDWVESVTSDDVLFEQVVVAEDEFVDFNRALAVAKERMNTLPRMGDGSPLVRKIKGMCEEIAVEYDVKAEDLYAALSGDDVINEGEPAQPDHSDIAHAIQMAKDMAGDMTGAYNKIVDMYGQEVADSDEVQDALRQANEAIEYVGEEFPAIYDDEGEIVANSARDAMRLLYDSDDYDAILGDVEDGDYDSLLSALDRSGYMHEGKKKDHDNDGDIDSDDYLAARDKAIKKTMKKESVNLTIARLAELSRIKRLAGL